jgi:dihydroorotate dehydrogenase
VNRVVINTEAILYKGIVKPVLFLFDSELVHEAMTYFGELLGKSKTARDILKNIHKCDNKSLRQEVCGIKFRTPIGLAAGFDYKARLTQILPSIGFGFGTVGTITYNAYEGNPKPLLGRLPKSKSLMVNKGFKNDGVKAIIKKLRKYKFEIPVGLSVGRTNSATLSEKESVSDIISAFTALMDSKVQNSYYELNISCPNLYGNVSFYPTKNLNDLLTAVDKLHIKKPVFVKMPINESDKDTEGMLKVISKHKIQGVIFGNLQKDRKHPMLNAHEVKKYKVGYFSGKPAFERSNGLIKLSYRKFGKKLTIIGCGGVFSAEDAYTKIKLGATLVQLITGLIYEGPQLPAQINLGLMDLLKRDGFKNIEEARGTDA